jgi:hypothetical protein
MDDYQRFVPNRVEGVPDVTEVIVHPDRLELRSAGHWVAYRMAGIARWPRPARMWRLLARLGWQRRPVPVADGDWPQHPPDRFFRFYTAPPIVVYMPADEPKARGGSCFARVQEVLASGGFHAVEPGCPTGGGKSLRK